MRKTADGLVATKREELTGEVFDQVGRMLLLQLTDQLWKDHLLAMDRLRQGVSLRGYGQRNPLLEYKREAFQMYLLMSAMRDEMLLTRLLRAEVAPSQAAAANAGKGVARQIASGGLERVLTDESPAHSLNFPDLPVAAPAAPPKPPAKGAEAVAFAATRGIRRNDPCPCGSGLKFKKCCGGAGARASA